MSSLKKVNAIRGEAFSAATGPRYSFVIKSLSAREIGEIYAKPIVIMAVEIYCRFFCHKFSHQSHTLRVVHIQNELWAIIEACVFIDKYRFAHLHNPRVHRSVNRSTGRGRHWNFDPLQWLGPRPEILDRYISLSCLRWLPTACHERLVYFHWPQWVTWLVTWWVTWSWWPDAGRHIGKFSLWTTFLRFSRSAQISLFSNFTKLGQLFFDNIFFGLTS